MSNSTVVLRDDAIYCVAQQSVLGFARAQAVEHDDSSQGLLDVHPQGTLYGKKTYLSCAVAGKPSVHRRLKRRQRRFPGFLILRLGRNSNSRVTPFAFQTPLYIPNDGLCIYESRL